MADGDVVFQSHNSCESDPQDDFSSYFPYFSIILFKIPCQGTNLPHRLTRMQKKQRELGADPKECLAAAQFISKAGPWWYLVGLVVKFLS